MRRHNLLRFLKTKATWLKEETLKIHRIAPETRLASSLSAIEIFTVLYYGGILRFDPRNINYPSRDRLIVSKGHGAISLYPVLADLGFFGKEELESVCKEGSRFGSIPDSLTPGIETVNGSLGHGLGVGCGIALALKRKKIYANVFVLAGDGELNEGSNWEAIMFAGHHKLNNLFLIIDNNKICMLDYCKNVIDLHPLEKKLNDFKWKTQVVDGHNISQLFSALSGIKKDKTHYPKALIVNTKKGKGVRRLENDPLCHIKSLKEEEVDKILQNLRKK